MKKRYIITLLSLGILGAAGGAKAQPQSQGPALSLHDCMEYAISNSTLMRLQEADRDDEQALRRQAIMQAFTPSLSARTYANNQYGRNLDPETNTYNTVTTFYNGYSVSAGITLFDGFQAINNLKMASASVKMGLSKDEQEKDRICLMTMEAFTNVVYWSEMEKVIAAQVETARQAHRKALRQEELGEKGHAEVVQMASELAQKEYQLISASNEKQNALITLKDAMYYPSDEPLVLDTRIPEPLCLSSDVAELESKAKVQNPSALIAGLELSNARLNLKKARGAYSPSLELYGGWSTTYYTYPGMSEYKTAPFKDQFVNNGGEYIQLQLSIPIFDHLSRRTSLQKSKNELKRAEAKYDQALRDIENEVRRAVNDRDGANAAFLQAERMADVQKEAFMLSTKQFETGLISALEYQTASQTYLNAMAEQLNCRLKLFLKDSLVRYYGGEAYINQ